MKQVTFVGSVKATVVVFVVVIVMVEVTWVVWVEVNVAVEVLVVDVVAEVVRLYLVNQMVVLSVYGTVRVVLEVKVIVEV